MSFTFCFWIYINRPRFLCIVFPLICHLCISKTMMNTSKLRISWTIIVLKTSSSIWSNGKDIPIWTTLRKSWQTSQLEALSKNSIVETLWSLLLHLVTEFMPSHLSFIWIYFFGNFDFYFLFDFYLSSLFGLWILSVFYAVYFYFIVFLESIFSFSVVNLKVTMCSESSEDVTQKEENSATVWRLFHISTWTSTMCTLAINIIHPLFSHFLILISTLNRYITATIPLFSLFLSFHG